MLPIEEDGLALALGRLLLQYGRSLFTEKLIEQVKTDTQICLMDICEILDQEELTDFQCIDEIVARVEREGLSTSRHDFG